MKLFKISSFKGCLYEETNPAMLDSFLLLFEYDFIFIKACSVLSDIFTACLTNNVFQSEKNKKCALNLTEM